MGTRPFQHMYSSADVRRTADELGSFFFSLNTMRFWGSRLLDTFMQSPTADDPEGVQVVYIVTSDYVTFERDQRGFRPRVVTVTRDARTSDGRAFDRIDIDAIADYSDDSLNGWFPTKARAVAAIRQHIAASEVIA